MNIPFKKFTYLCVVNRSCSFTQDLEDSLEGKNFHIVILPNKKAFRDDYNLRLLHNAKHMSQGVNGVCFITDNINNVSQQFKLNCSYLIVEEYVGCFTPSTTYPEKTAEFDKEYKKREFPLVWDLENNKRVANVQKDKEDENENSENEDSDDEKLDLSINL